MDFVYALTTQTVLWYMAHFTAIKIALIYFKKGRLKKKQHSEYLTGTFSCHSEATYYPVCGPGSSVGIATGYGAGRSGDRIPVGARFSAPLQTGPGAHPASCTMGTGVFPGVKRPGRDADPSPPSSAVVMKE